MNAVLRITIFIALTVALFVTVGISVGTDYPEDAVQVENAMRWIPRAGGIVIALIAALALLVQALEGRPLAHLTVLVFPLLAGLLLIERHWSTTIVLGTLAVAVIIKEIIALFAGARKEPPAA